MARPGVALAVLCAALVTGVAAAHGAGGGAVTTRLGWTEHATGAGLPALTVTVDALTATSTRVSETLSISNRTGRPAAIGTTAFAVILYPRSGASAPGTTFATVSLTPLPPAVLQPGATWKGTLSSLGVLRRTGWLRTAFGPFGAAGSKPTHAWITTHAYHVAPTVLYAASLGNVQLTVPASWTLMDRVAAAALTPAEVTRLKAQDPESADAVATVRSYPTTTLGLGWGAADKRFGVPIVVVSSNPGAGMTTASIRAELVAALVKNRRRASEVKTFLQPSGDVLYLESVQAGANPRTFLEYFMVRGTRFYKLTFIVTSTRGSVWAPVARAIADTAKFDA